jgi:hypothetical protein
MAVKYSKWPQQQQQYQHFPILGPLKFTQIGIFGSTRNHLATLEERKKEKREKLGWSKVTRLGQFSPIGRLFALGRFLKIKKMPLFWKNFSSSV